jgi:hypothetical protein
MLMLAADYMFWPAVAFIVGCNLYFWPRIRSDRMAMQWGFDGEPTWYAPKAVGLWGIVAFALAVRLLIWAAFGKGPRRWSRFAAVFYHHRWDSCADA